MPFIEFTALTIVGSLLWNAALISAGALLGDRWKEVGDIVGLVQTVVVVIVVAALVAFVWRRVLKPRFGPRRGAAVPGAGPDDC